MATHSPTPTRYTEGPFTPAEDQLLEAHKESVDDGVASCACAQCTAGCFGKYDWGKFARQMLPHRGERAVSWRAKGIGRARLNVAHANDAPYEPGEAGPSPLVLAALDLVAALSGRAWRRLERKVFCADAAQLAAHEALSAAAAECDCTPHALLAWLKSRATRDKRAMQCALEASRTRRLAVHEVLVVLLLGLLNEGEGEASGGSATPVAKARAGLGAAFGPLPLEPHPPRTPAARPRPSLTVPNPLP